MLGHRGGSQAQHFNNLADAQFPPSQEHQGPNPIGIGQGLSNDNSFFHLAFLHFVNWRIIELTKVIVNLFHLDSKDSLRKSHDQIKEIADDQDTRGHDAEEGEDEF